MDLIDRVVEFACPDLGIKRPVRITHHDVLTSQNPIVNQSPGKIAAQHGVEFRVIGDKWKCFRNLKGNEFKELSDGDWRHRIFVCNDLAPRVLVRSLLHELEHARQTEQYGPYGSRVAYTKLEKLFGYEQHPMEWLADTYANQNAARFFAPFDYLKEGLAYAA